VRSSANGRVQGLEGGERREAAQLFGEHADSVDVLLTDVVMPGKNGRELARELWTRRPELKTIFISGHGRNGALPGTGDEARVLYLSKPFSVPLLMKTV
jgi:two-component system cell cycle sensor histidine kinase/response regulator CckA